MASPSGSIHVFIIASSETPCELTPNMGEKSNCLESEAQMDEGATAAASSSISIPFLD